MAAFNRFNAFTLALAKGEHDLLNDSLRLLLSNDAPNATMSERADLTSELAHGNGYPEHGLVLTVTAVDLVDTNVARVVVDDVTLTATAGSVGPFRYVILYNRDHPNDALIGWYDRGSSITLNEDDEVLLDADQTNGLLRIGASS